MDVRRRSLRHTGGVGSDAKDALARDLPVSTHCRSALLVGLSFYGSSPQTHEFVAHRNSIARLFWSLLTERKSHPIEMRSATRLQHLPTFAIALPMSLRSAPPQPTRKCDRAMEVRAAFLACGSLATSARGYHLEFVLRERIRADRLARVLRSLGRAPKRTKRKGRIVLYYKEFDAIGEVLTLIGAFNAVLHLEDVRALRETKNRIHRLVNTEAANLERVAQAAATQRQTIEFVASARGLQSLSAPLREIANLRLLHVDESLAELGARCNPQIGKPTVASRLGAIARIASKLRTGREQGSEPGNSRR